MHELKAVLWKHIIENRDAEFFPEYTMHVRSEGSTPYDMIRSLPDRQYRDILFAADLASDRSVDAGRFLELTRNSEEAIRYWAVLGLLIRLNDTAGPDGTKPTESSVKLYPVFYPAVTTLLDDTCDDVKIIAAEIIGRFGSEADVALAMKTLMPLMPFKDQFDAIRTQSALWSMDRFAHRLGGYKDEIARLQTFQMKKAGRAVASAGSLILSIREKSQGLQPDYTIIE